LTEKNCEELSSRRDIPTPPRSRRGSREFCLDEAF
jgi:hypothetical protein